MNFKELGANLGLAEDEFRELIDLFLTSGTADFKKLTEALNAGDIEQVIRSAHTIKGASGNLGLRDVFETARLIESRVGDGKLDGLDRTLEIMQAQFDLIQARMVD